MRARRVSALATITPAQRSYLETGVYAADTDGLNFWFWVYQEGGHEVTWAQTRDALLVDWIAAHPGSRPWAWWQFDAREPRRRLGGIGETYAEGLDHGVPVWWMSPSLARGTRFVAVDPQNPPQFESQASYLERLNLFQPGERERLDATAFESEVVEIEPDTVREHVATAH